MSDRVWLVERNDGIFDRIEADNVEVVSGGGLRFSNNWQGSETVLILAPGQYVSVVKEED